MQPLDKRQSRVHAAPTSPRAADHSRTLHPVRRPAPARPASRASPSATNLSVWSTCAPASYATANEIGRRTTDDLPERRTARRMPHWPRWRDFASQIADKEGNRRVPHRPPPAPRAWRRPRWRSPPPPCSPSAAAPPGRSRRPPTRSPAIDGANGIGRRHRGTQRASRPDRAREDYPAGSDARLLFWISNDGARPRDTLTAVSTPPPPSRSTIRGEPTVPGADLADFAERHRHPGHRHRIHAGPALRRVDPGDVLLRERRRHSR